MSKRMTKQQYFNMKVERDKEASRRTKVIHRSMTKLWISAEPIHNVISEHNEKVAKSNPIK